MNNQREFRLLCTFAALEVLSLVFMFSPLFIFDDLKQHPWLSCTFFALGMLLGCTSPIIVWKTPEPFQEFILFCFVVALLILPYAFMLSPLFIFDDIRQHPWLSCALFAFGMLAACQRRRVAMLLAFILIIIWKTPEHFKSGRLLNTLRVAMLFAFILILVWKTFAPLQEFLKSTR